MVRKDKDEKFSSPLPDAEVGDVLLPALLGGLEGVPGTLHQAPGLEQG